MTLKLLLCTAVLACCYSAAAVLPAAGQFSSAAHVHAAAAAALTNCKDAIDRDIDGDGNHMCTRSRLKLPSFLSCSRWLLRCEPPVIFRAQHMCMQRAAAAASAAGCTANRRSIIKRSTSAHVHAAAAAAALTNTLSRWERDVNEMCTRSHLPSFLPSFLSSFLPFLQPAALLQA